MTMQNPKLHVIFKKEDIKTEKIDGEKVAVVFDVLLATTTIATLLKHGATEVIPVKDVAEALRIQKDFDEASTILAGESYGLLIDGFLNPLPTKLKDVVVGKTVILSTTNGTVALSKVANAKKVYAGALVNGKAVAEKVATTHTEDTIIVVCSGSRDRFSLEDFYGAGYFIQQLLGISKSWVLTDSAQAALYFYQGNEDNGANLLRTASTGQMLIEMDCEDEVVFSTQKGINTVVPELVNGKMIIN